MSGTDARTLGIVVVGLGRAGKARVRDLKQKVLGENAVLRGVISRRKVEDDLPTLDWDEALSREDINALIICTENDTHEEYARKALEHGKHVLVDYPLCLSAQGGKDLFNLAESKGLICHVENIALLLPAHQDFKKTIKTKDLSLKEGTARLEASFASEWFNDINRAGFPSFSGVSTLECLTDLFGSLTLKEAHFVHETDRHVLTCKLFTSENRPLTWKIERLRECTARKRFQEFIFEDGTVLTLPPPGPPPQPTPGHKGLFARDLELFLAKVRGECSKEIIAEHKKLVLDCLELAEEIKKVTGF